MGIFLTDGSGNHLVDDVSGADLVDNADEAPNSRYKYSALTFGIALMLGASISLYLISM